MTDSQEVAQTSTEDSEQAEFRAYCRAWLTENKPPPTSLPLPQAAYEVTAEEHRAYLVDWQSKCYEAGFIATDVAKEYGGHGPVGFQQISQCGGAPSRGALFHTTGSVWA